MANQKPGKSLDDMLQADRKKRKAEALAQDIFGKNKRQSLPGSPKTTPVPGGSLASRMGVTKRSASSSSITRTNSTSRPSLAARISQPSALGRSATTSRFERAVTQNGTSSPLGRGSKPQSNGRGFPSSNGEINIRGAAGPYTVVAQNLAPGTTAADIESVLQPSEGQMLSCKIVATNPTVIAEMIYTDKAGAEGIISKYNNQRADGRVLFVSMKHGGGAVKAGKTKVPEPQPIVVDEDAAMQEAAMEVDRDLEAANHRAEREDVDRERSRRDERPYDRERDRARDSERDRNRGRGRDDGRNNRQDYGRDDRRAAAPAPAYQDGRYGFGGAAPSGPRYDSRQNNEWRDGGRMYSDDMMRRQGQQGHRGGRW